MPAELHARVLREYERFELVNRQIKDQEKERRLRICQGTTPAIKKVRRLLGLRGIGLNGAFAAGLRTVRSAGFSATASKWLGVRV